MQGQGNGNGGPPWGPPASPQYGAPGGFAPPPQQQQQQQQQQGYAPQQQAGYGPPGQQGFGAPPQQQGYGAPNALAPAPGGFGPPAGAMAAPGSTVLGVALEPGERVIYFKQHNHAAEKWIMIVLGVLFLVVLIGAIFIYLGVTAETRNPKAHALTNRRLIFWPGKGEPQSVYFAQVTDMEPVRQQARGGGGLIGMAVGAAVSAAMNHMANKNEKTHPKYWNRAVGINFTTQQGRVTIPAAGGGAQLGLLAARCVFNREGEQLPAVQYAA